MIDAVKQESDAAYAFALRAMIAVIVVAVLLTAVLGLRTLRSVTRSLGKIQQTFEHVSQTLDLSRPVPVERMDEIGRTAAAFNKLLARIVGGGHDPQFHRFGHGRGAPDRRRQCRPVGAHRAAGCSLEESASSLKN
jgi:HAMP domain-containing protein